MRQNTERRRCCGVRLNISTVLMLGLLLLIAFYTWCLSRMQWGDEQIGGHRIRQEVDSESVTTTSPLSKQYAPEHTKAVQIITSTQTPLNVPTIDHRVKSTTQTKVTTTTAQSTTQIPATTSTPQTTVDPTTRLVDTLTSSPTTGINRDQPEQAMASSISGISPKIDIYIKEMGARHIELTSFEETETFLKTNYGQANGDALFLLFLCTRNATGHVWSPECENAEVDVYSAYLKSQTTKRLATIRVGATEQEFDNSQFKTDFDLRVLNAPLLMRYERNDQGYAFTSFVLRWKSLHDPALLDYVFTEGKTVQHKAIEVITDYKKYRRMAKLFEDTEPTYLLFISGSWPQNGRMWCGSCRFREAIVEYAFHTFAAPNAKLIKVEVAPTPQEWNESNPFKKLEVAYVPYMLIPHTDAFDTLFYQHFRGELDEVDKLQAMFERDARFAAETEELNPGIPL